MTLELMQTLEAIEGARNVTAVVQVGEYTGFRQAYEAVDAHLDKYGPTPKKALIQAILDGGWGPRDANRDKNVKAGIRYGIEQSLRYLEDDAGVVSKNPSYVPKKKQ